MKYQYRRAPNPTEFSVFEGLGVQTLDLKTLAKDVPCQAACPAKTDVPAYIEALAQGDANKSYRINLEDNVFPSVLGRTCTRPCEDACRHNWTNVSGPVHICHLKRAGADHNSITMEPLPAWFEKSGKRIAVVGGGPSGLTAARELVRYGHSVVLFEREDHLGGMMIDGIPRFRLPRAEVDKEIDLIVASGVEIRYKQNIDAVKMQKLIDEFDAVLVAAGTMKPKTLGIEPVASAAKPLLSDASGSMAASTFAGVVATGVDGISVYPGLDFMKKYNEGGIPALSGDVVVVGGGFTAVDCSRACARAARRLLGSEHRVSIMYRRTEAHMAADLEELDEIRFEQIDVYTLVAPISINAKDGKVVSVTFERNKLADEKDREGKPRIVPIEGSRFDVPASHVIVAIGQDSDYDILPAGIKLAANAVSGDLDAEENPGQRTSHPKVFAAGDFLTGSQDVIHAVAEGKAAADEIDRFLTGQRRVKHHVAISLIENRFQTGRVRDMDLRPAPAMPLLSLKQRIDAANEVELGHAEPEIAAHASRCYLCNHKFEIDQDKCIHCDWCIDVAPRDCIKKVSRVFTDQDGVPTDYVEATRAADATFIYIDSDECIRCGKCLRVCPTGAITMRRMERSACASKGHAAAMHGAQASVAASGNGASTMKIGDLRREAIARRPKDVPVRGAEFENGSTAPRVPVAAGVVALAGAPEDWVPLKTKGRE